MPINDFADFAKDVHTLLSKADISLTCWSKNGQEAIGYIADPNLIDFNGKGKDAHETLYITRIASSEYYEDKSQIALVFGCCKTALKPYDKYVVACLLLAKYHFAPKDFVISSDGDASDWQAGLELLNKHFSYGVHLIKDIDLNEGVAFSHPKNSKNSKNSKKKKYADEMGVVKEPKESKELKATPEEIRSFEINYMQ